MPPKLVTQMFRWQNVLAYVSYSTSITTAQMAQTLKSLHSLTVISIKKVVVYIRPWKYISRLSSKKSAFHKQNKKTWFVHFLFLVFIRLCKATACCKITYRWLNLQHNADQCCWSIGRHVMITMLMIFVGCGGRTFTFTSNWYWIVSNGCWDCWWNGVLIWQEICSQVYCIYNMTTVLS